MTTVQLNGRTFGMIDVPEDAKKFWLSEGQLGTFLWADKKMDYGDWCYDLPSGNWKLHGLTSKLTETDWQGIVEEDIVMDEETGEAWKWYKDYLGGLSAYEFADESGLSLLASQGKEAGKTVIVELLK